MWIWERHRLAQRSTDNSDDTNEEQNNLHWVACSHFWLTEVCVPCDAKRNQGAPQEILLLVSDVWVISMVFTFHGPWNIKCLDISSLKKRCRKIAGKNKFSCGAWGLLEFCLSRLRAERWAWGVNYSDSLCKGHFVFIFLFIMNDDYISHYQTWAVLALTFYLL